MENVSLIKDTRNNAFCLGDLGIENKEQNENPQKKIVARYVSLYFYTDWMLPWFTEGRPLLLWKTHLTNSNSNQRAQLRTLKFF